MDVKQEIGKRLEDWALKRYKTLGEAAKAIGISKSQLSQYIHGYYLPGNKIQDRLRDLGCDTILLMTGNTKEELDEKFIAMKKRIAAEEMTKDVREILDVLRKEGINTAEPLKEIFDNYRKMRELIAGSTVLKSTKTKKQRR